MKKEEKNQVIDFLKKNLTSSNHFYLMDISNLDVKTTNDLRRICFKNNIKLQVVKNTLLRKAMKEVNSSFESFNDLLKGSTSIMFSETANVPAKIILDFSKKHGKPSLKGAYVEEMFYMGADQLDVLVNIKSKNEVIGDIINLLQSPVKSIVSSLQANSGMKIAGIVKTLSK